MLYTLISFFALVPHSISNPLQDSSVCIKCPSWPLPELYYRTSIPRQYSLALQIIREMAI